MKLSMLKWPLLLLGLIFLFIVALPYMIPFLNIPLLIEDAKMWLRGVFNLKGGE